jgi:hypothetical protein
MASFTVSTNSYWDSSAFSTRTGNDTYTISSGATLTIDTDTRYCANATLTTGNMGALTISSASGGTLYIDGTSVRLIPYNSGTGNVPAIGTTISQGSVSAYFLGVWSALNAAPTNPGSAMPASGFIKVKNKTGGNFSAGALSGIGATATAADVAGWIEVVGTESTLINVPRLGNVTFNGDWFYPIDTNGVQYTTSGVSNQTVQLPASLANTYYPGVWIETGPGTNQYEFYPNAGSATSYRTDAAGKVCWISSQGLLRIGNSGSATAGYTPPAGCKIRVPNIVTINVTSATMQSNAVPNSTLGTRHAFNTSGAGSININCANLTWYPQFTQPYSLTITNTGICEAMLIAEVATPLTFTNVGVGQTAAISATGLTATTCFAGGTMDRCVWTRAVLGSGLYCISMTDCSGFTITNEVCRATNARSSTTSGMRTLNRVNDSSWTNYYDVGGKSALLTTCRNLLFKDGSYCDPVSGTTGTATAQYTFVIQTNCRDITIDGLDFWGLTNVQPYAGMFNILSASSNIKIRNIGSPSSPLDLGTTNGAAYLLVGANSAGCQDIELKRVYTANTRTGFQVNFDNSYNKVTYENVWVDADDTLTFATLNTVIKGMRGVNTTTGQAAVYGTHWFDLFTSATAGRIGIIFNEKTSIEPSASSYTVVNSGTGFGFNSQGSLQMPNLNDEIIYTTPHYIIGHNSFQNAAPTLTGTNVSGGTAPTYGSFTLYYKIDKNDGNGYDTNWKGLTAANLSAETGIDSSKGFKLQIRIVCTNANATNALAYLTIPTNADSNSMSYQYPLDLSTITLTNVVSGSAYEIYNLTTSTTLATGTASGSTVSISAVASNNDQIRIRVRKSSASPKYIPFETQATIANLSASVFVSQVEDTIAAPTTNGTIANDFTVNTTAKTIRHTSGTTVYTVNELYTWLMDYFDGLSLMDDTIPMSAETPSEYTLINGWFIDNASFKYLKGGAIQTSGQGSYKIHILTVTGGSYNDPVPGDLYKTVKDDGVDVGPLVDYEIITAGVSSKWYIRDTRGTPAQIANASAMTIGSGTGSGNASGNSISGENIWSNIFTLGTLVSGTTLDLYQNDTKITPWWGSGHIDILVKVKEAGTEIDSGNLTVLARKYSTLYDHYLIDASTGRNPVPLAAFTDTNNQTAQGTVGAPPYTNITISFGATSQNLNNGNGPRPYDASINCAGLTLTQVYEYLKYVTRSGSSTTLNGVSGEFYQGVGDIRLDYTGETNGPFVEGNAITSSGGGSGYIVSVIDNGSTGTLVIRNVHGNFENTQTITSGSTTATINGTPDTITKLKQAPFGTFAGGKFFGARGVWIYNMAAADANNYQLIDSTNTTQIPPSTIPITVNGLAVGDRVSVFRTTGDNEIIDKSVYTSHATANTSGSSTFTVTATIDADTPSTGTLRVVDRNSSGEIISEQIYTYTSWSGSVFNLSGTLSQSYDSNDTAYVPYIDTTASSSSVSVNVSYAANRYVVTRVRKTGIIPFSVRGQITNTGLTVTAIRTTDSIVN